MSLSALYKEDLSQLPNDIIQRSGYQGEDRRAERDVYQRAQSIEGDINYVRAWIEYEFSKGESDVIVPYVQASTIELPEISWSLGRGRCIPTFLRAGRSR